MMHSRSRASLVLGAIVALAASPRAQESQARFDAPVIVAGETVRFEILLDLNGDGFQDVVDWLYTQSTGTGVRVGGWINDGSGRLVNAWNVPLSFPSGIEADLQDAAAGNLNGDRFDDFALTFDEQVLLFVSNGDLPPTQIASLDAGGAHLSIVLADFDGDGLDDLASSDGSATIRLNEGGGVFVPAEAGWSTLGGLPQYDDLHAIDVDDDGSPDLADIGGGSLYLHTIVDGLKVATQALPYGLGNLDSNVLAFGDIDADGDDDAVVFDTSGALCAVIRHQSGGVWAAEALQAGGPATHLADVNGDGAADGVCCSSGGSSLSTINNFASQFEVALNDGQGDFAVAFAIPSLGGHHIAGVADLDHDGDVELVAGRSVFWGHGPLAANPLPVLSLFEAIPTTAGLTARSLCDADADGDPDVGFGADEAVVNAGDATFSAQTMALPPVPDNKKWLGPGVRGDFDGDGDLDVLVPRWQGPFFSPTYLDLWMFENNGSGLIASIAPAGAAGFNPTPGSIGSWSQPESGLVADADGDGDLDLLRTGSDLGGITRIALNDGTGWFSFAADIIAGPVRAVALLDGDARPDLVIGGAHASVWFGTGGGAFVAGPTLASTGEPFDRPCVTDVDGNGTLDVLVCDEDGERIDAHLSDGLGHFTRDTQMFAAWPMNGGNVGYPRRILSLDIDADGRDDLVAMPALHTFTTAWVLMRQPGGGWEGVQQALVPGGAADFDGDGDLDLLTQMLGSSPGPTLLGRNLEWQVPEDGLRRQIGAGSPGTGGVPPLLGASGPFRVGSHAALILRGAPSSAVGLITVGLNPSALPDFPWAGTTAYNWPWVFYVFIVSPPGQPGVAGSSSLKLNYIVPASAAGIGPLYHQVFWRDLGALSGKSSSNGLLLDYE